MLPKPRRSQHGRNGTGHGIRYVIVTVRRVVYGVFAAACRLALKRGELGDKALIIKQVHPTRIDSRKQVNIEVTLGFGGRPILYAPFTELFP